MSLRKTNKASPALIKWINEIGVADVAKLLKTDPASVRHWRRGFCLPRSEQMVKINRYSKGKVSYAEMIDTFFKA